MARGGNEGVANGSVSARGCGLRTGCASYVAGDRVMRVGRIMKQWALLYLRREVSSGWDAPGLLPLGPANVFAETLAKSDGISGAPVFFIDGLHGGQPGLGFAGMVLRADKQGRVNLMEAAQIHHVLEQLGSEATPLSALRKLCACD